MTTETLGDAPPVCERASTVPSTVAKNKYCCLRLFGDSQSCSWLASLAPGGSVVVPRLSLATMGEIEDTIQNNLPSRDSCVMIAIAPGHLRAKDLFVLVNWYVELSCWVSKMSHDVALVIPTHHPYHGIRDRKFLSILFREVRRSAKTAHVFKPNHAIGTSPPYGLSRRDLVNKYDKRRLMRVVGRRFMCHVLQFRRQCQKIMKAQVLESDTDKMIERLGLWQLENGNDPGPVCWLDTSSGETLTDDTMYELRSAASQILKDAPKTG